MNLKKEMTYENLINSIITIVFRIVYGNMKTKKNVIISTEGTGSLLYIFVYTISSYRLFFYKCIKVSITIGICMEI